MYSQFQMESARYCYRILVNHWYNIRRAQFGVTDKPDYNQDNEGAENCTCLENSKSCRRDSKIVKLRYRSYPTGMSCFPF